VMVRGCFSPTPIPGKAITKRFTGATSALTRHAISKILLANLGQLRHNQVAEVRSV
jgi:hypothetical protein